MEESPGAPGLSLRLHVGFGRRNLRSGLAAVGSRNERVDGVLPLGRQHREHLDLLPAGVDRLGRVFL